MIKKILYILISILILSSCGEEDKVDEKGEPVRESMDSGILEIVCDKSVFHVLDSAFNMYNRRYDNVKFSYDTVTARKAMALILSGNIRAAVIARDYLLDEDSLMKQHNVDKHLRMQILEDALVFFTQTESKLDTINEEEIKQVLQNKLKMTDIYPFLDEEPLFVINEQNSSEYANLMHLVTDNQTVKHPYRLLNGKDSVINYVKNNENVIGIGYLSQIIGRTDLKPLRVGFINDSTDKHVYPQVVHQAYIVMRKYPWIVTYYAYLLKDKRDLPYWFATYLAKENVIQKYFLDYGLVPTYAKFKLIPQ